MPNTPDISITGIGGALNPKTATQDAIAIMSAAISTLENNFIISAVKKLSAENIAGAIIAMADAAIKPVTTGLKTYSALFK